jgi:DNA polymerase III gamma/tau subunit
MIATTHSISQLPATIASRAMIFHVDRLSDVQMDERMNDFMPESQPNVRNSILTLAAGRPGVIVHYQHLGILDDIV